VAVDVVLADGSLADMSLIDISAGGVGMASPSDSDRCPKAGENITLRFRSKRLLNPLEIPSQVRHVKNTEQGIHYGIAFDDWAGIRSHLAPKLRSLFNEREAVRVEPRPDEEVAINIHGASGDDIEGWLRDISVLGVGMWITAEDHLALEGGQSVQVQFKLPRSEKALTLEAQIRYQQVVGDRARLGLQIVNDQPGRWNGVHREITQYVMSRQIEIARIDAERKRAMSVSQEHETD